MSSMRLPFLLLALYLLCDYGVAQTTDESTQVADQDSLRSSPEDVTEEEEITSVSEMIESGTLDDDSEEDADNLNAPSSLTDDTGADAVGSDNGVENSDSWLGQEYGVIVAIPPRLSEPPDMNPSDWIPTVNPEFSLDVVQAEEVDEGWAQAIPPNFDEVIKKAVQNIYPLPEPLLAKALALTDDPTVEVTRRLQVEFNQARKRALLADVELRRLSGEQKVFISKLLQDSGATPAKSSTGNSESPPSADVSGSADEEKAPSKSAGSADLEEGSETTQSGVESANTTSASRPSPRPSSSTLSSLSTKGASAPSKEANGDEDDNSQVTSEVLQTKGAIEQVNDVLSNINQALGGATTSTVSPPVAIAQGVQNFISGLNLLALQLAKESS